MERLRAVATLALLLAACSRTATPPPVDATQTKLSTASPPPSAKLAIDPPDAADPIEWQLTASATRLSMADRGEFELWIVARNTGTHATDTRRDGLEYLVNGRVSFVLAMAFGNGVREGRWSALAPGDTVREARGGPTEPDIGKGLFPAAGDYELAIRRDGRVVATLHVNVTSSP